MGNACFEEPMRRREFITLFSVAALAGLRAARAQQVDRVRRVGVLVSRAAGDPEEQARFAGFLQGLQKLGWTDGGNLRIDYRWAAADADRSRTYAAELVALAPDVILASWTAEFGRCRRYSGHRDALAARRLGRL
jgi:putative ABC transport system substrate-binding protein